MGGAVALRKKPTAVVVEKEKQRRVLRDQNHQQASSSSRNPAATECSKKTTTSSKERRKTIPPTNTVTAAEADGGGRPQSTARSSRATEKSSNAMWIRPRSKTPHSTHHSRMDPVQLYQYYQHEWERFKTNLPGESNRAELRWQIRHKLLGE